MVVGLEASAQTFTQYTTTEQLPWQTKGKVSLSTKAKMQQTLNSKLPTQNSKAFKAWNTSLLWAISTMGSVPCTAPISQSRSTVPWYKSQRKNL